MANINKAAMTGGALDKDDNEFNLHVWRDDTYLFFGEHNVSSVIVPIFHLQIKDFIGILQELGFKLTPNALKELKDYI